MRLKRLPFFSAPMDDRSTAWPARRGWAWSAADGLARFGWLAATVFAACSSGGSLGPGDSAAPGDPATAGDVGGGDSALPPGDDWAPLAYEACPAAGECPDGDCLLDSCFVDCADDGVCPVGYECLDGYYCLKSCANAAQCGDGGCCWGGSCMSAGVCANSSDGDSCLGHCGGHASGGCFCNANCVYYDDCCADRAAVCGQTGTCAGACGGESADGCFCDAQCEVVGNCCPDYATLCAGVGTCAGACGGQSADGCWCDPGCAGFGNCCPDYEGICL